MIIKPITNREAYISRCAPFVPSIIGAIASITLYCSSSLAGFATYKFGAILITAVAGTPLAIGLIMTMILRHSYCKYYSELLMNQVSSPVNAKGLDTQEEIEQVKRLLLAGADIETKTSRYNETPLHMAATYGKTEIVRTLVKLGADIEARDRFQSTPLHEAAKFNRPDIIDVLIEFKADKEARNSLGETPLYAAVDYSGDRVNSKALKALAKHRANIQAIPTQSQCRYTPLHRAVEKGRLKLIQTLLDLGADKEARWKILNGTPLHLAASCGNPEVIRILIKHGADLKAQNENGETAYNILEKSDQSVCGEEREAILDMLKPKEEPASS